MNGPFKSTTGIAYPSDMTVLKLVFDRVCKDYDIKSGSRDADDVARAAMSLFGASGLTFIIQHYFDQIVAWFRG